MEGYRHCLFLRNGKKKLLQYNNNINIPKDFLGKKCLNSWRFIRHSLLEVKMRKFSKMEKSGKSLRLKYFPKTQL